MDDALTCLKQYDPTQDCTYGDSYLQGEFQCIQDLSDDLLPSTQEEAYNIIENCVSDANDQAKVKEFFDQQAAEATASS